jgi:predicted DNA-binding protein (MmcQ/YjbR family)
MPVPGRTVCLLLMASTRHAAIDAWEAGAGDELLEAIDASYDAVVAKLPERDRPRSG